jgi:iron complex outermembrane recepter protein
MSSQCKRAALGVRAFLLCLASGVATLTAAPAARADDDNQLQEVVVTAEKRAEDIKDVPTSISEISGEELNDRHIADYDDITRSAPSISFTAGGSEGTDNIEIRGVSSGVGASVVGVYLDESSITAQGGQTQPIPFDLARLEVLRGPQGTLYGASSMGGAIRFITNQPNLNEFQVNVTSDVSDTDHGNVNYNESIVLNEPIAPGTLAVRVGVDAGVNSGWIDHYNYLTGMEDNVDINQVGQGVIKAALTYKTEDGLTITPSVWLQRVNSQDSSAFDVALGLYNTNKEVAEPSSDRLAVPSLTISKDLGVAELTSVTSYFWRDDARTTDGTYFNDGAFALYFLDYTPPFSNNVAQNNSIIAHVPSPSWFETRQHQVSEELRATSRLPNQGELPLKWTAGLYYSSENAYTSNVEYSPGLNAAFQSIYGYPLSSPIVQSALGTTATTFANDVIFIAPIGQGYTESAAFGELGYDLLPRLHAAVGVRYEVASEQYHVYQSSGFYALGALSPFQSSSDEHAATPKFSATYDLSSTSTAYGTISEGYRLGGGTGPNPSICNSDYEALGITNPPTSYKSDHLWNYEIGTKMLVADRSLSIDASVYLIQWSDIQQVVGLPTCGFAFVGNFGDARSEGGELQVAYKPQFVRNLTLGLILGGGHSYITSTVNASAASVGQETLNAPNYSMTATANYRWNYTSGVMGFARTDFDRIGTSYGSFKSTDPNYINPAYGVLNASFGIDTGTFQAYLYGKNLLKNDQIIQYADEDEVLKGYTVRPLTVGINIAKQFR